MDPTLRLAERLTLTCAVTKGDLPLTINWMINDDPAMNNERVKIMLVNAYTSILTIDSLQLGHSGNYSCIVQNEADRVSQSQLVIIQGIYETKSSTSTKFTV